MAQATGAGPLVEADLAHELRLDPGRVAEARRVDERGILAAQKLKPQAAALAETRGLRSVEVDLALLRGEREPDLTLFAS